MHRFKGKPSVLCVDFHGITISNSSIKESTRNTVFNFFLNDTLQRARAKLWVVSHVCQKFSGRIAQMQSNMAFGQARAKAIYLYIDNVHHLGARDLVEHY